MIPTETPGAIAHCDRCQRKLQVAAQRRKDSKPFRLAKVPKGVCPECVMTQWLYNTYPVNMQIDIAGPELLLKPHIREAFLASGVLNGDGYHPVRVYAMPAATSKELALPDFWASVTDVPCPRDGCRGTIRWNEAGYVPGYRICDKCKRTFFAEGNAKAPYLAQEVRRS